LFNGIFDVCARRKAHGETSIRVVDARRKIVRTDIWGRIN
jgi:hypothetical protein